MKVEEYGLMLKDAARAVLEGRAIPLQFALDVGVIAERMIAEGAPVAPPTTPEDSIV